MASTARSLRYALAILTTSLVTPSVWAHAHLMPFQEGEVACA